MAQKPDTYRLHYVSADSAERGSTWSVYAEEYATPDAAEPLEGSTQHLSTHPSETDARTEAERLQAGTHNNATTEKD